MEEMKRSQLAEIARQERMDAMIQAESIARQAHINAVFDRIQRRDQEAWEASERRYQEAAHRRAEESRILTDNLSRLMQQFLVVRRTRPSLAQ